MFTLVLLIEYLLQTLKMRPFFLLLLFLLGLQVLAIAQPENDDCANAFPLNAMNGGCFFNATMVNATQTLPAANCQSALVQDIWFSFVADSSFHQVSVNPTSGMDAVVEVRKGDTCTGMFVACIDEGGGDGAVENLALNDLTVGTTYFIRVYDFTGVGSKPSSWNLDICISGFEPTQPPSIQLISPKGREELEAGSVLNIQANVTGVIAGKELQFSKDNGKNWEIIYQSSSPNPNFKYDWIIPSINSDSCLLKAVIFQLGVAYESEIESPFSIFTNEHPRFKLDQELSHLYWPFYNPNMIENGPQHVPSTWQNQEEGILITKEDVVNTWFFLNDHYWQSSDRWHHSGDNCFAQDWNFINGGNSDCGMYFFSPMAGKVLFTKDACLNFDCANPTCTSGCGNYIVVQSTDDPSYVYRACHFSELNPTIQEGTVLESGDWVARVGNEGSSSAAHVHFVLYKNLEEGDIATLASGSTLSSNRDPSINPENLTDLCFDKAANFRFDVPLDNPSTNLPVVHFEPVYQLKVFPNPNQGIFKMSLNTPAKQFMEIAIFDPLGRKVFSDYRLSYQKDELIDMEINTSISGLYIAQVRFDQEVVLAKFLIRKY